MVLPVVGQVCSLKIFSTNDKLSIKSITINNENLFSNESYIFSYTIENFTITQNVEIVVEFYKDGNNY